MQTHKLWLYGCGIALILTSAALMGSDTTANVAGTWTVSATGMAGTATQSLVIQQDGGKISGTFKGPRQSGTLEGTVTGNTIKFHVNTRMPLDYEGTVDGDTMKGSLSGAGRKGDWTASGTK